MGFSDYDKIINAITVNEKDQRRRFNKDSITTAVGYWYRLWNVPGYPGAGAEPGALTGSIPTKDTVGAIPFVNPTGPATLHMIGHWFVGPNANSFLIFDRLWHCGGVNLNTTSPQSITFGSALSRYSDGINVGIAIEITTASGGTASTMTISYTNTDDVSGRSATIYLAGSRPISQVHFPNLQSGDKGVKSIQSISMSSAMGAGVANLVLYYEIDQGYYSAGVISLKDLVVQFTSLPRIYDDACLSLFLLASTTTSGLLQGGILLAEN